MKNKKTINDLKKLLEVGAKNVEGITEEELTEFQAYSLINPIQIPLNESVLNILNKYSIEIIYDKTKDNVFVMNKQEQKVTTLSKFLEIHADLLEDFIIHNMKKTLQKQNIETNLKSKIQIKSEKRAEEIKNILGEETFGILDKAIKEEAMKKFEKDLEKIRDVEISENKKMC